MTDVLTKKQRSYNMSMIKDKNTKPEVLLYKELLFNGFKGFKRHYKLTGKPDIVFPKYKIAIFVDGCFWHKCPKCFSMPATNKNFWKEKINCNVKRDRKVNRILKKQGWIVMRLWEHDINKNMPQFLRTLKNAIGEDNNGRNVLDLFCGAGGMSYGFQKAGFNIIMGVDHEKKAIDTFAKNHKKALVLCEDIRKLEVKEIREITGNKKIDVIIGGPPCQGFSMAGKRKPNDPRNSLFREYLRIVKGIKPAVFVMENVKGLLSMKADKVDKVIDIILREFRKIGYRTEYYSVNTANYGVPQKRPRIFIIGTRKKYKFSFPATTHSKNGLSLTGKKLKKWVCINKLLLSRKKINKKYFYSYKLIKGFRRRAKKNRKNKVGFGWQFLNPKQPSFTISARYWKDGAEALVKYSKNKIRMLTPFECAHIQSFPKNYKFEGNKREIYTQIGNSVPPKMAKIIAKEVFKTIYV